MNKHQKQRTNGIMPLMHTNLGCKISKIFSIMQMFFCLKCFFVTFAVYHTGGCAPLFQGKRYNYDKAGMERERVHR